MNMRQMPRIGALLTRNWRGGGGAASIQAPKGLFELTHHHPLSRELARYLTRNWRGRFTSAATPAQAAAYGRGRGWRATVRSAGGSIFAGQEERAA